MPRAPLHALVWSRHHRLYELYTQNKFKQNFRSADEAAWLAWLNDVSCFAFHGRDGRLNVYKETRPRGGQYWYAYHTTRQGTRKRYLGRTTQVTLARLEQEANWLNRPPLSVPSVQEQGASSLETRLSLLSSRLSPPPLPSWLVSRARLLDALDAARSHPLILVSASVGSGKTSLLSAWARGQEHPVAWLSLDALDDDPIRFWSSVIAALRTRLPEIGERAQKMLRSSPSPPLSTILTTMLEDLLEDSRETILLLDDYHVISNPAIAETMLFLLDHLPANLHLVLATSTDPALPLSRLRVHSQLIEIRDQDLHFTLEETISFLLQRVGLPLSEEDVAILQARTEGWIAGLQLAALSLSKRGDVSTFVKGFAGSHRYVLDYVQQEILARLPSTLQDFLLQTSILTRMNAALCQAVTALPSQQESQQMLEELERANLFVVPLDEQQQWYRYHDLFREALRACLQASHPQLVPLLHMRAARWYEEHDLPGEAIENALVAQEFAYAATLIEQLGSIDRSGEHHTLYRWLEQFPQEVLQQHPILCLAYARAILFTHDRHAPATRELLEVPLHLAEEQWGTEGNDAKLGEVLALRALIALWQDQFTEAFALAKESLRLLPQQELQWRGNSLLIAGKGEMWAGNLNAARQLLTEARICCEASGNMYASLATTSNLADVCFRQGDLHQAASFYQYVLKVASGTGEVPYKQWRKSPDDRCQAMLGLAGLSYEWNDLESTEHQASEALAIGNQLASPYYRVTAALILAHVLQARGSSTQAQQLLQNFIAQTHLPRFLYELLLAQARLSLANGDLAAVQRWVESASFKRRPGKDLSRLQQEQEDLLLARLLIARRQLQDASRLLQFWQKEANEMGRGRSTLEILILMALTHLAGNDLPRARQTIRHALELAQPQGAQRLFLDEGEPMEMILRAVLPEISNEPLHSYVRALVRAFAPEPVDPLEETTQLSQQELRVLRLLTTGRSKTEIARELVVSINTVKTHVRSIYRKLNVKTRKDAYDTARRLHLL